MIGSGMPIIHNKPPFNMASLHGSSWRNNDLGYCGFRRGQGAPPSPGLENRPDATFAPEKTFSFGTGEIELITCQRAVRPPQGDVS